MAQTVREQTFESAGGLKIFIRSWWPEAKPRAVMVICHGVNSHGGQYIWPAEQFVKLGFAVYALDLRGRGRSEGERFYVEHVSECVSDVAGFICESFAFQVPAPGFALAAIKGLSHIAPRLPVLTLKNEDFSRDPKAVAALNSDPLIARESQPAITVAGACSAARPPSGRGRGLLPDR